jgi:hypothetical protein
METTARHRRLRRRHLLVAAALAVAGAALLASASPSARADSPQTAVLDWNKHALAALANAPSAATPGAGQTPPVTGLHLAMVHGAVYDAVNSIAGGYEPYVQGLPPAPSSASQAAAAARAAHDVLVGILNQVPLTATFTAGVRAAIIARLDSLLADAIAAATAVDGASAVAAGVAAGDAAADAMLAERTGDGRYPATPFQFAVGTDPGEWRPTSGVNDPFAWVAKVRPFVVESNTQFISKGPRELDTGGYAKEYEEVKELGAVGSVRTPEQQALAAFFQPSPVEMFYRAFREYALHDGLDLPEQARLFAMLGLANADAFITCWEDKAQWNFWRPITAIREGDNDGNPKTVGDPTWTSLIPAPPYPEHASGYNCATGSLLEVGELWFGQGRTTFTISHPAGTPSRTYEHFRDVWADTIDARIYQGIHFRSADEQGALIGRDVARWVEKHAVRRAN